jgi:hypothetical protein
MRAKLSRHPNDPKDTPGLSLAVAHSLVGAGGAVRGVPGSQPVFDISDIDEDVKPDVKPDVKMEDDSAGSSSGGRRCGGRGRSLLRKPLSVAHQFGLQWRTSGAPRISSHWYLLPVAHALVRHG